jgi:hypothetical protein
MTLSTFLRGVTKNSSFLHFMAILMSYCPHLWGSRVIYKVHDTQYQFKRHDKNSSFLRDYGYFPELLPTILGVPGWSTRPMTLSTCLRGMTKTCNFCILGPFSWAIAHYFGFTWRFTRNMTVHTF